MVVTYHRESTARVRESTARVKRHKAPFADHFAHAQRTLQNGEPLASIRCGFSNSQQQEDAARARQNRTARPTDQAAPQTNRCTRVQGSYDSVGNGLSERHATHIPHTCPAGTPYTNAQRHHDTQASTKPVPLTGRQGGKRQRH